MRQVEFSGSLPQAYERGLRSFLFDPYAKWLQGRLQLQEGDQVLELAAGTGALTSLLHAALPPKAKLVATDLQGPMLDIARQALPEQENLSYQVADALDIPFEEATFDLVVVQFGWMFFPDKEKAASEIARVLKPGGKLAMLVWNAIERNEFALVIKAAIAKFYEEPPRGFDVPWGFGDQEQIRGELSGAGFEGIRFEDVDLMGLTSAEVVAHGMTRGTPVALEIMERMPERHDEIETAVADALRARFGKGEFETALSALFVGARVSGT